MSLRSADRVWAGRWGDGTYRAYMDPETRRNGGITTDQRLPMIDGVAGTR